MMSAKTVAIRNHTRLRPIGIAPFVTIMTTMNVGMKVRTNWTTWLPVYDQNVYLRNLIGLSRSRTILPDWMDLLMSQTTNISRKLNNAVARIR